jgi:hypothetical protein
MFNTIVALGTVALQIFFVAIIFAWIFKSDFLKIIYKYSNTIIRVVFVGAAIGSLVYQYILNYPPCLLCWYQRIAIFAVALIVFVADIKTDKTLQRAVILLSVLGLAVAIFHNIIDIFPTGIDACGANGPSCLARYVYEFGYITIPMMSLSVLVFGVILPLVAKRFPQNTVEQNTLS